MTIDKITEHIYAFRFPNENDNELYKLFEQWSDVEFLHDFFTSHFKDLAYFNVFSIEDAVNDTIEDAEILEAVFLESDGPINFEAIFAPLHNQTYQELSLSKNKAKRKNRSKHDCWLRIYAIKVENNLYVITGGTIKLTHLMEQKPHTMTELNKIEKCRNFLKEIGIFDVDSFNDYIKEEI